MPYQEEDFTTNGEMKKSGKTGRMLWEFRVAGTPPEIPTAPFQESGNQSRPNPVQRASILSPIHRNGG